ncbi:MAG: hypothetical protein JSS74_00225 [Actinobacteria bacterium]|nr:hypothetical protein [Actinomycetota bacterium]
MTRRPGSIAVIMRTVLTAPSLSVILVLAIAALTGIAGLVPGLIDEARTATLRHQIDQVPAVGRPLTASQPFIVGATNPAGPKSDVWSGPLAAGAAARAAQPEPLRGVLGETRVVGFWGGSALVADRRVPLNFVQLVMDPGLERRSTLVQGRHPKVTDPAQGVEVVVSAKAATKLDWKVGEVRTRGGLSVTLVGTVAPNGADDLDWDMLVGSRTPTISYSPMGDTILQTIAFLAPDEAARLTGVMTETTTFSWIPIDTASIDARNAAAVSAQLRLFIANPVRLGGAGDPYDRGLIYRTPVADAIDGGIARGDALTAVVAVAAVGPIAVAAVLLALAGRQLARRRLRAASLARARGASLWQLIAVLGGETLGLGLIGVAIGVTIDAVLSPRPVDAVTWLVALLLVAVPVCAVLLAVLADLRERGRRGTAASTAGSWRRLLVEAVVVGATVVLAVILLTRGQGMRVDPVLLGMPLLIGASGTVIVLRLLPLLLDALLGAAARRRGLIALLGPARTLRDAGLRTAPALAAVIGIAATVFAVSFSATVTDSIARTARDMTGADIAVSAPYFEDAQVEAARKVPGVAALASLDADEIGEASSSQAKGRVRIYAVDRAAFARVQHGSAGALPMPSSLTETSGAAIPVVASEALLGQFGDRLSVNGHEIDVVARTAQQAPFGKAEKWVIVDRANIGRIGVTTASTTRLFVAVAPGHDQKSVAKALTDRLGATATVTTTAGAVAAVATDPASAALRIALLVATAVVAVMLALAILQTLLLGSEARSRLLALLRTVGYPRRRELPLVGWEVGPALLVALPIGIASGLGMSWLVIGALDLRAFTGGQEAPVLSVPVAAIAVTVLAFLSVTVVAVLVATATAMRLRSAEAIRIADDED